MATVASIIVSAAISAAPFVTGAAAFSWGAFLANSAIGLALYALSPKPSQQSQQATSRELGYNVTQFGSAIDHQIIYGKCRAGGVVVYDETTGNNNKFLHRIIAFTGHEIESFEDIYINDEQVVTLDGDGNVSEITGSQPSRYNNRIRIKKYLGTADQTADSDLISESSLWTSQHRLRGISYLYIRFKFDADRFPNGVPEVTATIKGKKVYDPRDPAQSSSDDSTWVWSDNPALCIRDYLSQSYGLNEADDNIDDDLVTTAANVCDETDTLDGSTRYTCNGNFTTGQTPYQTIQDLLTSMGGKMWYSQGKWRMKPAYWSGSVLSFDENDLRGPVSVSTRHSRRDNYNSVKGTFRGEESDWQVTDYPPVENSSFVTADNGLEQSVDLLLPFTDTSTEARRIARIALEENRNQLNVQAAFGLKAFQVQVGDVISLTNDRFGWDSKFFEVVTWTFGLTDDMDLQVNMTLRETQESVFDEVDDGEVYERDNTSLLSPFEAPPVGISATAATRVIAEKLTNVVTITVTGAASERIDLVEVQYKLSTESEYKSLGAGELGEFELIDTTGADYDFRARSINTFGVRGDWESLSNVSSAGTNDVPEDVSEFTAEVNGANIFLEWEPVTDNDLSFYRLRHSLEEVGATYANATTAVNKVPRPANSVSLPARPGTYHIKAFDKAGQGSENYTSVVVPEADLEDFTNTDTQTDSPTFSGTKTDCSVDSSELIITDVTTAPSEATYDFSTYIDTGAVRRVRARIDINVNRRDNTGGLWDDLPGNFDDLPGLFDDFTGSNSFADTNVISYISVTDDDPAGSPTWTAYKQFRAGEYSGRAFRFRVVLKSTADDVTPAISGLTARVQYN